jgi:hypothetical protein
MVWYSGPKSAVLAVGNLSTLLFTLTLFVAVGVPSIFPCSASATLPIILSTLPDLDCSGLASISVALYEFFLVEDAAEVDLVRGS